MASMDKAASIFGNIIDEKTYKKACEAKERMAKRYGAGDQPCHLRVHELPAIGTRLGARNLLPTADMRPLDLMADAASAPVPPETPFTRADAAGKPVVVANIRMGFGHYRIAMAMASAAHAMGYTPYWLDFMAFPDTTAGKVIAQQNKLYSMGSRLSQKVSPFNSLYWEPLNSEGFRKLSYNASDQKVAELFTEPLRDLPRNIPYIGTHAWTAQAAVHAGLTHVVNAIPDNWPMALHLAEGSIHTVQTPSAYLGYKTLRGMEKGRALRPMPKGSLVRTGHYIDHELVTNVEADCERRLRRLENGEPVRYLLSVGGAGAQFDLFKGIIEYLLPRIAIGQASLLVNVGDHQKVWDQLVRALPELQHATCHFDDFEQTAAWAEAALDGPIEGVHAFYHGDIFAAVYSTNLLMRCCDALITKPSELAYYPVPKLMIQRVGGHEAWGAVRAAEVGDGTYELATLEEIIGFMELVHAEPGTLAIMNENIVAARQSGVYDGAYEVVELATRS